MHLVRRCLLAFLLLFAVPLAAASSGTDWLYQGSDIPKDPSWQFGTLPNGLRYAVRRNALPAGQVSIRVRIDAGSLHEEDQERGWAHFVEHLAFRGTRSFEDREARQVWQQFGAGFGSDTNASTGLTQTIYQLDLPKADRGSLDKSLAILAEMMDSARFEPAAVEGERKIVLAEKAQRSEMSERVNAVSRPLFYGGHKLAERDPIGIEPTLLGATAEGLRAFYERWYRPDRTTLVIVGDADPALLIELLTRHFGGWHPTGPPPREPDFGTIAERSERVGAVAYPGAPFVVQLSWLRPPYKEPNTIAQHRIDLTEQLAMRVLNRRLEAKARGEASFLSAGLGASNDWRLADITNLNITARDSRWRESLNESFAILADALRAPPSPGEIAREISNMRTGARAAMEGESTVRSPQWARQMVNAVDGGEVVTTAAAFLRLLDQLAPDITPAAVHTTMQRLLKGSGPRLLLISPTPVDGGTPAINAALTAAEQSAPAIRQADRTVTFDSLPRLGPPGREVSRRRIEDMDVTIVRFANGATLTFKQTDFQKGSVSVQLRFGNGVAGLSPQQPSPASYAGVLSRTGLADLDLDGLERLLTGRRIGLNFGMEQSAFVLRGGTSAEDLGDQLRLLALKLAYPRWDDGQFIRAKTSRLEGYDLSFASATARAGREMGAVMHPGDARWMPMEKDEIARIGPADFRRYIEPMLGTGPIEAIIVGDVDLERAVKAMAATIGALPARPDPGPIHQTMPPRPDPKPKLFTHSGDRAQAYAQIGWTTTGRAAPVHDRHALAIAADILRTRMFDRLRETEGVTYSPSFSSSTSDIFPKWGVFVAEAQVRPESVDTFLRIAREAVADLAKHPVSAEEFARALNPRVSSLERGMKTNNYWMTWLADWPSRPELIEQTRTRLSSYKSLTPQEVQAAVAAYVADEGDWSMLVLPEKARPDGN